MAQEEILSLEINSESTPETLPLDSSDPVDSLENLDSSISAGVDGLSVSGGDLIPQPSALPDVYTLTGTDELPLYESYESFLASPVYVTRYEYEVLNKLEFIQYALAIMIALLFLLFFKKK